MCLHVLFFNEENKGTNLLSINYHMTCIGKTKCRSEKGLLLRVQLSEVGPKELCSRLGAQPLNTIYA